jgi:hypothetical protein
VIRADLEIATAEWYFSHKAIPPLGSSAFRDGVGDPKPNPLDADLRRIRWTPPQVVAAEALAGEATASTPVVRSAMSALLIRTN